MAEKACIAVHVTQPAIRHEERLRTAEPHKEVSYHPGAGANSPMPKSMDFVPGMGHQYVRNQTDNHLTARLSTREATTAHDRPSPTPPFPGQVELPPYYSTSMVYDWADMPQVPLYRTFLEILILTLPILLHWMIITGYPMPINNARTSRRPMDGGITREDAQLSGSSHFSAANYWYTVFKFWPERTACHPAALHDRAGSFPNGAAIATPFDGPDTCSILLSIYRSKSSRCRSHRFTIKRTWTDGEFFEELQQAYMKCLGGRRRKYLSLKGLKTIIPLHVSTH